MSQSDRQTPGIRRPVGEAEARDKVVRMRGDGASYLRISRVTGLTVGQVAGILRRAAVEIGKTKVTK